MNISLRILPFFFIAAHSQNLQLRGPSHLQDIQETADAPPSAATSSLTCGCSSCDQSALSKDAEGYRCESRIDYLIDSKGYSEYDACVRVSHDEYPTICGPACDPLTCNSAPPSPPSDAPDLGLCYGYGRGQPTLDEQVKNDMDAVANCYATSKVGKIRTYFPSFYGKKVTDFAPFAGKRLLAGFNPRDALDYKSALDNDLKAIHGDSQVEAIIYLNEKFGSDDIKWAEEFLRTRTSSKPIVTSQTTRGDYRDYTELLSKGFDGIMINVYPSRTFDPSAPTKTPQEDFESFCGQVDRITNYYRSATGRGEHFYGVSETGVPAVPFGTPAAKGYYELIQKFVAGEKDCPQFSYTELVNRNVGTDKWLGVYAFEATSEPNKGSDLENSFGITNAICPSFEEEGHLDIM